MTVYDFDLHEGSEAFGDDEGMELVDLDAAQYEAARSLSEVVRLKPSGPQAGPFFIEVRDSEGPVMRVGLSATLLRTN